MYLLYLEIQFRDNDLRIERLWTVSTYAKEVEFSSTVSCWNTFGEKTKWRTGIQITIIYTSAFDPGPIVELYIKFGKLHAFMWRILSCRRRVVDWRRIDGKYTDYSRGRRPWSDRFRRRPSDVVSILLRHVHQHVKDEWRFDSEGPQLNVRERGEWQVSVIDGSEWQLSVVNWTCPVGS